jgi:hypothetical protein
MRIATIAVIAAALAGWSVFAQQPRPAPPLNINAPGGKVLTLDQYKGKIVALALISTVCEHCQELTGQLATIQNEYGPKGVQVIEAAFNDANDAMVKQFIAQFKPTFPVGWADRASVLTFLQWPMYAKKPLYVPHMVFIDRSGMIRSGYPGESDFFRDAEKNIRAELDKLLAASRGGSKKKK